MRSRFVCIFLVVIFCCCPSWSNARADEGSDQIDTLQLEQDFLTPPDHAKPWAYWWWVNGNVTEQSITRDLQEMKRKGIAGLLMLDSRNYHDDILPPPPSRMEFMSPPWRHLLKFAFSEGKRLGLEMSVNLSSGAGALKGPWDVGDDAPKKLVWTSTPVQGPRRVCCDLQPAADRCWDIAVIAVRHQTIGNGDDLPAPPTVATEVTLSTAWQEVRADGKSTGNVVEVVDLSDSMNAKGQLEWDVPNGRWTLLRFASVVMPGHENDVDILSGSAVETYFNRMGTGILQEAGDLAGQTLTHFYNVSWEGAAPTWTLDLEHEFRKYRQYDMRSYLAVLTGLTVNTTAVSARFLRDYHKTLGDCFMHNCYGKLHELCNQAGLKWHSESGGPWNRKLPSFKHADQLAFLGRNDMPQGEFWHGHNNHAMNRPAAMASHLYGQRLAATEAFTHMRPHWFTYPAALKPDADAAFCDGINHFIWHTFTASPSEFGKPGIEYFAGTHLNPNVTWWEQSHALLTYLARCQLMLRQGHCVVDVCCYTGDKPYLHWGRGGKWSRHSDLINTEVLMERVSVENGDLVLPDGMRYRLLVVELEDETVSPLVLEKIIELAKAGATVVLGDRKPTRAPGLQGYPECDQQVKRLAGQLWGAVSEEPQENAFGQGTVVSITDIDDLYRSMNIVRDFSGGVVCGSAPKRTVPRSSDVRPTMSDGTSFPDYVHRRSGDMDIYFISGEGHVDCTFRVKGKEPEFWDPMTGRIQDVVDYRLSEDGRPMIGFDLPENGSIFVVFRKPVVAQHVTAIVGPGDMEIKGRIGGGLQLHAWDQGHYRLVTSDDDQLSAPPKPGQRISSSAAGTTSTGIPVNIDADEIASPYTMTGPWQLQFTPGWGAPESVVLDHLIPWNEHPDQGVKFYSGTVTYRNAFELTESHAGKLVRIDLGEVKHIADVRVNGKPMGVVWTAPWTVDVTEAVRPGKNLIEIDVSNLWVNRLIGDADLPNEKRFTGTNALRRDDTAKFPHLRGYSSKEPLVRSGLLGPVRIEFGVEKEVRF